MTFTLKWQGNWYPYINKTQGSCCSTGNRRCKPVGLVPCVGSSCYTMLPEDCTSKKVPGLPLPVGLVLL
jgi:hypothetical protein